MADHMDASTVKRLALVRHLFNVGIEQSHQPEPMNCISLLSFHDAVEWFLQLTTEHHGISKKDQAFMGYWDVITAKLGKPLHQRESMKRMNRARSQLKHHGVLPASTEVESFRVSTTNFFIENTPLVFDKEFEDISLADFVNNQDVRSRLSSAQKLIKKDRRKEALKEIAIAFEIIIDEYRYNEPNSLSSPFRFGDNLPFPNSFSMRIGGSIGNSIDAVSQAITQMQGAITILCLGLDYRKYVKFKNIVPHVIKMPPEYRIFEPKNCEMQDLQFCFDYLIESAIHLQNFDYRSRAKS